MGACCTKDSNYGRAIAFDGLNAVHGYDADHEEDRFESGGSLVRLRGSSKYISMAIKQGKKRINQDALIVWENFMGKEDIFFCGVFDGHGPSGHKIARYVRDRLPSKLHSILQENMFSDKDEDQFFRRLEEGLIKAFKEVDEELGAKYAYDSFCSGTTAVVAIKKGEMLMMANLGDSRAVLCTKGRNHLHPIPLTMDLKPNIPSEFERIRLCKGRIFATESEPGVYRVWMPDDDCPGLAMSRAFGDFCLKDYGLISMPDISYRRLNDKDAFVVLATDGIWDVLTNHEVVKTVALAKPQAMAAEHLIQKASQTWKTKYPTSRADDCAVICLFLKEQSVSLSKSFSRTKMEIGPHFFLSGSSQSMKEAAPREEDGNSVSEVARVDSVAILSRFTKSLSLRRSRKEPDGLLI